MWLPSGKCEPSLTSWNPCVDGYHSELDLLPSPTPLHTHRRGSVEAVRELLDLGCGVNVENARGSTPLHFAAAAKQRARETCEALLAAGADTGLPDLQGKLPYEVAESDELR